MAYRSWLKDVKRLDDLAKHLHFFPSSHTDFDREWKLEEKMYKEIADRVLPVEIGQEKYFQGQLHDGHVLGYERTESSITLEIGNILVEELRIQIDAEMMVDREVDYSPVRLVFEGVTYANAVRPDPDGWLKWDDWEKWDSSTDWFSRCWFHEQEGKVQWVGQFHKYREGKMKQSGDLFVLIDCDRVVAKPESERALRKRLGDECYEAVMYIQGIVVVHGTHQEIL